MPGQLLIPFVLTFRLWWRYWPQLMALVLAGLLAHHALLWLAVQAGFADRLAGLAMLTLVVLAQLVVTILMFQLLLPALPALQAAQAQARGDSASAPFPGAPTRLASALTVALLPFFAYYAAWGFLGDTVRQYSRLALDLDPFGTQGRILDALDSRWLLLSVAISWLVRKAAKRMQTRSANAFWQILVVVCETNWILVGLYVISRWKDDAFAWIGSRAIWGHLESFWAALTSPVSSAWSATMVPVEATPASPGATLVGLFFYALLPVIWLVMCALIYGYDLRNHRELVQPSRRLARVGERYQAIPKFLRDVIDHFAGGYRSRYVPLANSVRLTMSAGFLLLVTLIVGYRLIDWGSAWLWMGTARLIGPHDVETWRVLSHGLTLLAGSPFRDSSTGILVEPVRICFLAAILETVFSLRLLRSQTQVTRTLDA